MAISTDRTGSLLSWPAVLARKLSLRPRKQLAPVMALMLAGAAAERLTIGALLPFLELSPVPATIRLVLVWASRDQGVVEEVLQERADSAKRLHKKHEAVGLTPILADEKGKAMSDISDVIVGNVTSRTQAMS